MIVGRTSFERIARRGIGLDGDDEGGQPISKGSGPRGSKFNIESHSDCGGKKLFRGKPSLRNWNSDELPVSHSEHSLSL